MRLLKNSLRHRLNQPVQVWGAKEWAEPGKEQGSRLRHRPNHLKYRISWPRSRVRMLKNSLRHRLNQPVQV